MEIRNKIVIVNNTLTPSPPNTSSNKELPNQTLVRNYFHTYIFTWSTSSPSEYGRRRMKGENDGARNETSCTLFIHLYDFMVSECMFS